MKWHVSPHQYFLMDILLADDSCGPQVVVEFAYLFVGQPVVNVDGNVATPTLIIVLDVYACVINSLNVIWR